MSKLPRPSEGSGLLAMLPRAATLATLLLAALAIFDMTPLDTAPAATRFAGPTSAQPLALTADGAFLAVANADNHTVSCPSCSGVSAAISGGVESGRGTVEESCCAATEPAKPRISEQHVVQCQHPPGAKCPCSGRA